MSGGIEESIYSQIESATGEAFDTPDDTTQSVDGKTVAPDPSTVDHEQESLFNQLEQRDKPVTQAKPDQNGKPEQKKPDDKKADQQQVDENGKPISHNRFHAERRLTTKIESLQKLNTDLSQRQEQLTRQLAEQTALNGVPKQLGLNTDEVLAGLEFVNLVKQKPADAAKKAIEIALARGANLRDIVNDEFIPNVTLSATQRMLDERLGPLQRNQEQEQRVQDQQREVQAKVNQFAVDYPDAMVHQEIVADQMRKIDEQYAGRGIKLDPYVLAEKAWQAIEGFAQRNQLDIAQPLGPQLQARESAPVRQATRPMPNGSNGGGQIIDRSSRQRPADDSWDSIVKGAMRESGYRI